MSVTHSAVERCPKVSVSLLEGGRKFLSQMHPSRLATSISKEDGLDVGDSEGVVSVNEVEIRGGVGAAIGQAA